MEWNNDNNAGVIRRYLNDDPEMDLSDLIRYLCKHVLIILAVGILGAGSMCAVYVRKNAGERAVPVETEETAETDFNTEEESILYPQTAYMDQAGLTNALNSLLRQIQSQNDYILNSVLMRLDPNNVAAAKAVIRVSRDKSDSDEITDIVSYYERTLHEGSYLTDLADELNIEPKYLSELILVSEGKEDIAALKEISQAYVIANAVRAASGRQSLFYLTALGQSEEQADKLLECALAEAERVSKSNGFHYSLEVVNRWCGKQADQALKKQQRDVNLDYITLMNQVSAYSTILPTLKASVTMESDTGTVQAISKKGLLKYSLAGCVGGILLMIFILTVYYIFSDKLSSYKRLQERYFINHMGSFRSKDKAKRFSESDTIDMICANLRLYAGKAERILIAGGADHAFIDQLKQVLSDRFPEISFSAGGSIAKDYQARESLCQVDAVILTEERKHSRYSDIQQELEFLETVPVKLLGVIIA